MRTPILHTLTVALGGLLVASPLFSQGAPQSAPPLIPVRCAQPQDVPLPQNPTPPLTAEAAEARDKQSRAQPGVIAIDEPYNFGLSRRKVDAYYDCLDPARCYWTDIDRQSRRAQSELTRLAATRKPGEKLAMVLDIDETALTSYCEEKREDYGYIPAIYEAWNVTPQASIALPGTLALFNQARTLGVDVFFVSGRPGKGQPVDQTEPTARNLAAAGYKDWKGLLLHDASFPTHDLTTFKSQVRATIAAQGYRIVLNVGDQWTDLNGDPRGEVSVKLPNPIYYLP